MVHSRHGGPVAVPAMVELDEGPWLSAGLVVAGQEELTSLRAGQPVSARFIHPDDGASYPVFGPLVSPG